MYLCGIICYCKVCGFLWPSFLLDSSSCTIFSLKVGSHNLFPLASVFSSRLHFFHSLWYLSIFNISLLFCGLSFDVTSLYLHSWMLNAYSVQEPIVICSAYWFFSLRNFFHHVCPLKSFVKLFHVILPFHLILKVLPWCHISKAYIWFSLFS